MRGRAAAQTERAGLRSSVAAGRGRGIGGGHQPEAAAAQPALERRREIGGDRAIDRGIVEGRAVAAERDVLADRTAGQVQSQTYAVLWAAVPCPPRPLSICQAMSCGCWPNALAMAVTMRLEKSQYTSLLRQQARRVPSCSVRPSASIGRISGCCLASQMGGAAVGVVSLTRLDVDAFPDTTPVQVQINTIAPALGPEEVERQITAPIEQGLGGLPGLEQLRSVSKFGFSQVVAVFRDGTDIYFARQLINERLASVDLPPAVARPKMGPVATGLGEDA